MPRVGFQSVFEVGAGIEPTFTDFLRADLYLLAGGTGIDTDVLPERLGAGGKAHDFIYGLVEPQFLLQFTTGALWVALA